MENLIILANSEAALPDIGISADMLKPVLDGVTANIGVILPICISLFAIMIGVKLVPKFLARFVR